MASLTNYGEIAFLDHLYDRSAIPALTGNKIVVCTSDPTETGDISSAQGTLTIGGTDFGLAAARKTSNTVPYDFGTKTDVGTIAHLAITDSADNAWWYGPLDNPIDTTGGKPVLLGIGTVTAEFLATGLYATATTDFLAHKLLDLFFRNSSYPAPTIHNSFSSTTPNPDGTNVTEVTGITRPLVPGTSWTNAGDAASEEFSGNSNSAIIDYGVGGTGGWSVASVLQYDAVSSGNLLVFSPPPSVPATFAEGEAVTCDVGGHENRLR